MGPESPVSGLVGVPAEGRKVGRGWVRIVGGCARSKDSDVFGANAGWVFSLCSPSRREWNGVICMRQRERKDNTCCDLLFVCSSLPACLTTKPTLIFFGRRDFRVFYSFFSFFIFALREEGVGGGGGDDGATVSVEVSLLLFLDAIC